jgi:hypothetical protein
MLEALRRQANEAAQDALHEANAYYFRHGVRNRYLDSRYVAAERLLDMVEERIRDQQAGDPEGPDYFGIFTCEAEARGAYGDK